LQNSIELGCVVGNALQVATVTHRDSCKVVPLNVAEAVIELIMRSLVAAVLAGAVQCVAAVIVVAVVENAFDKLAWVGV
jgi:hypothetical protein